ncbi:MAG: hypothetical protein L0Y54_18775, partial [Sporichthyaceae bacterium]|nr:hypothetical protein [Sporichthyaceae bacterium]
ADRLGRRLPISAATAVVITGQQQRVRARYPETPIKMLKLLPALLHNPDGSKAIRSYNLSGIHRVCLATSLGARWQRVSAPVWQSRDCYDWSGSEFRRHRPVGGVRRTSRWRAVSSFAAAR